MILRIAATIFALASAGFFSTLPAAAADQTACAATISGLKPLVKSAVATHPSKSDFAKYLHEVRVNEAKCGVPEASLYVDANVAAAKFHLNHGLGLPWQADAENAQRAAMRCYGGIAAGGELADFKAGCQKLMGQNAQWRQTWTQSPT